MSDSNSTFFPSVYFESLDILETDYRAEPLGGIGGAGEPPIDAMLGGIGGAGEPPIAAKLGGIGGAGEPPIDVTLGGIGGAGEPPIDARLCLTDVPANTTKTAKANDKT